MDFSVINWFAVLVCVVVSMATGAVWYHPKTFFNIWWKGIGKKEGDVPGTENMTMTWILTVLAGVVQAVAMAFMVPAVAGLMSSGVNMATGILTGFMIWLGFVAPTYLVNKLFAGHGFSVWLIEIGNHLLNFVIFGAILGAWR